MATPMEFHDRIDRLFESYPGVRDSDSQKVIRGDLITILKWELNKAFRGDLQIPGTLGARINAFIATPFLVDPYTLINYDAISLFDMVGRYDDDDLPALRQIVWAAHGKAFGSVSYTNALTRRQEEVQKELHAVAAALRAVKLKSDERINSINNMQQDTPFYANSPFVCPAVSDADRKRAATKRAREEKAMNQAAQLKALVSQGVAAELALRDAGGGRGRAAGEASASGDEESDTVAAGEESGLLASDSEEEPDSNVAKPTGGYAKRVSERDPFGKSGALGAAHNSDSESEDASSPDDDKAPVADPDADASEEEEDA
jgi:hypothetical protein